MIPEGKLDVASDFINTVQETVESTTRELIGSIESASRDIGRVLNRELSQKPWTYLTTCVGSGIVLGYLMARAKDR